jgi:hypothetical protein
VIAGNATLDRADDGSWRPGGPALYSARIARELGARVTVVTRLGPTFDTAEFAGAEIVALAAPDTCRYALDYDSRGTRRLALLSPGSQIHDNDITIAGRPEALILAPAYHEFDGLPTTAAPIVAVCLQGALRTTDADGNIIPAPDAKSCAAPFLRPGVFAFYSQDDTADPDALARFIASEGATAIVTRGHAGATVVTATETVDYEAIPAHEVDPTGAGDCFATAFVVMLAETGDREAACSFAIAAGSLAVEGPGLSGVPTRARIEERLRREAA